MSKNYELVTVKKGTITTVDGFIKSFNAIGHNMKALSVSAYNFLTSDNVELKKDFQIKVMDELKMTRATMTYMKTAGWLYRLDRVFDNFSYTNVIYFKKAIDYYNNNKLRYDIPSDCDFLDNGTDELKEYVHSQIEKMLIEISMIHDSRVETIDDAIESLKNLSQKDLRSLIDKYVSHDTEETEETEEETEEETTEDTTEDVTPSDEEITEVNLHLLTYTDDEINSILDLIDTLTATSKVTKQALIDGLNDIADILKREVNDEVQKYI